MTTPPVEGHTTQLVLASASAYRARQLEQLRIPFIQRPAAISETRVGDEGAATLAERLAESKARDVMTHCPPASLIIGCDQTADLDGNILGKPGNANTAVAQLLACSGKVVTFYSAICIVDTEQNACRGRVVETRVHFRELSKDMATRYVGLDTPLDCAGSFKCEGLGIALFTSVTSDDPSALIGLPLIALTDLLIASGHPVL